MEETAQENSSRTFHFFPCVLIRRLMCAGDIWYMVNFPIYGLRHLDMVSLEKRSGRLFIIN